VIEDPIRLGDREAIRFLQAAYTHFYDDGRLDDFVALFAEAGVLQLGPGGALAESREAIRSALAEPIQSRNGIRHFTSDELIEFTADDSAVGTCRFAVHMTGRSFDGTYHDEYARGAEGWRIARRTITIFE
jgi:3-phenylpropionate/cinnamic acid dioxygenase small subunit